MTEHPKAAHTPSGHGAPIARFVFVRSGRFCAVRAVPAPAAPMTEHPKATHTPSGHGAPIARLGFVRSGRFCAVRAARAPAAPMTEHSQSRTHSVRTRRSHRPPRFCPQRAFLRGSRCSCASRADDGAFPKPPTLRQDTALPSPASGGLCALNSRRGRLSSLPTPPSPFHISTGNAACPEALCRCARSQPERGSAARF